MAIIYINLLKKKKSYNSYFIGCINAVSISEARDGFGCMPLK